MCQARRVLSLARLLNENAKSVAVAVYNILRMDHFFFEFSIRGYELVSAVRRFDEQKTLPFSSVQALEQFFGQDHAERVTELAYFQFNYG